MRAFPPVILLLLALGTPAGAATVPSSQAARQPGETPEYYFMVGRHLESVGRIEDAIAAHRKAIALDPESAELRAELAGLYARQDRAGEALETAESALKLDPDNREANKVLGSVYAALADQKRPLRPGDDPSKYSAKALEALTRARRDGVFDVSLEMMLGRLYLQAGMHDRAIASLRRVVDDQPGYSEGAMMLAAAYEGAGNPDGAIRTLEAAVAVNPALYRAHVRLAELYEKAHRYEEAASAYAAAQKLAGGRADFTAQRASALMSGGQTAAARELLESALARKGGGTDGSLLFLLGQAQRQLKDAQGAKQTAEKLKAASPPDVRGLYLEAQLLQDAGRLTEAVTAFEALMKRAPGNRGLVYEYANLLEKSGRVADAERELRRVLAEDPLDADALNSLGYMFAERGERLDEAVDLVQRALKVEPGNPSYLDSLGWAYFRQGRLDMAEGPLAEAAAKSPASSTIQDHLGDLRMKQQRYAEAASAWERALEGDGVAVDRAVIDRKLREARERLRK